MTYIKPKSAFAAAAHVLSYPTLQADRFIAKDDPHIDWDGLYEFGMKGRYSDGERALVACALALWNGGESNDATSLGKLMQNLSDEPYRLVVEAMLALRPLKYETNVADPFDDYRLVSISHWQITAVTTAASILTDHAESLAGDDHPEVISALCRDLLEIVGAWNGIADG